MFPIIPLLCIASLVAGAGGLAWYESLSKEDQVSADRHAAEIARRLYQKSVRNLTRDQAENVASIVRQRLGA